MLSNAINDGSANGATYFRVTDSGALFYVPGRNDHSLVKVNRSGNPTTLTKRRAGYRLPSVSPDARRVAVTIDPPDEGKSDIWILDIERDSFLRLTTQEHNLSPVWTPDGQRVFWARGGDPFWKAADGNGEAERLVAMPGIQEPRSITPDGRVLLVASPIQGWGIQVDIWGLPLDGNSDAFPILDSRFSERYSKISPNGRWLAYISNQSGRYEVYVQRFPEGGRSWAVSAEGGRFPVWSRDGKELFFIEGNRMMVAPVQTGDEFTAGRPVFLFARPDLTAGESLFDVMGNDFVMVQRDPLSMLSEFRVVQNFLAEIERLSPAAQ